MMWKWSNVPIPEAHVVGLAAGILLHYLFPQAVFSVRWFGFVLGGLFFSAGTLLAAWTVLEAADMPIDSPHRLIVSGPYALSRNPMYIAWGLLTLGTALLLNSIWLLVLLPLVLLYVHFVDIKREERLLEERFGREYAQYRAKVRRYL